MKKLSLIMLPLIAIATPAWGQAIILKPTDCNNQPNENDEIIGSGCLITVTGNLSSSISETTEKIADVVPSQHLESALLNVPGLQQFRRSDARSANPTSQGITLRGLGGNASSRAVLVLDGVPQADPFGGWISWPGYDALNLASIRVRKGGGLASVGPGALGGVIELDSLQRQDRLSGRVAYGSRNSIDAKAALLKPLGAGSISLSGSYAGGDGFIPIKVGQRGSVDRAAIYEQAGIALRAAVPLSPDTELQFSTRAFTDERDRGFEFSDNQNSGVDGSIRVVKRGDGWQYSALAYVQLREFATRFGGVAANRNSVSLVLDQYSVPSTGLGARLELRPPVGENAELRIGGEWRRTIGETHENFSFTGTTPGRNRNAGGRTDTVGAFAEASLKLIEKVTVTFGGRVDRWNISNGFRTEINLPTGSIRSSDQFADRSGWEGTGRAGFAFQASDAIKLRGAGYMGWRLPTLNELYRPFRVGADATAANELLSPERLKGAEIGVEYDNDDLKFSATAFYNRLDNAIANVTLGNGPGLFSGVGFVAAGGQYSQRKNLDAIESKGIEIDVSVPLTQAWKAHAGYSYIDAKVIGSGISAAVNGLRPAQVPRHFASIGLGYDNDDKLHFDGSIRYVGSQFEDDGNSRLLKDAITADATASYLLGDGFRVELRGENLFDVEVQAAISSSVVIERATPRTLWIGFNKDF
jgi:vitamin B12 transporter